MEPEEMRKYLMEGRVIILHETVDMPHDLIYKFDESVGLLALNGEGAWEESVFSIDKILNEAHRATVY